MTRFPIFAALAAALVTTPSLAQDTAANEPDATTEAVAAVRSSVEEVAETVEMVAEDTLADEAEAIADAAMADAKANMEAVAEIMDDHVRQPDFPRSARPRDWRLVKASDYPPAAFVAGEEGRVGIKLEIGADGSVVGCGVTESSGFTRLDEATCPAVRKNANFEPAVDKTGTPVRDTLTQSVDWRIRRPEMSNVHVKVSMLMDAEGDVSDCEVLIAKGELPRGFDPEDPCRDFARAGVPHRDEQGNPVPKRMTIELRTIAEDPE